MNYNLPYYKDLFENYGFKNFYNQICWYMMVDTQLNEKFREQAEKYNALPDFSVVHIQKKEFKKVCR